jgi:8-hydroxy-5-deazaflavin:NADPH oxidoreductase
MPHLGLIGGTGDLGYGLAVHLAKKYKVMMGSRNLEKAKAGVAEILEEKKNAEILQNLEPAENSKVVQLADILLLTVPHANALETVKGLSNSFRGNQIFVSAVAAVAKKGDEFIPEIDSSGSSFAQQIRATLPESIGVAAAFQTVPANVLYREMEIKADVPIAADSREVYEKIAPLVLEIRGLRPLFLGSLRLSGELERLTALLLNIGRKNGLKSPTVSFPSF